MIKNWIKIAFTNYKKSWLTTIINLLGLSMGLTIFLLVFLNWQDEKAYEKWFPGNENIYFVELETGKNSYASNINYPVLYTSPKMFPEIENYSVANIWPDSENKIVVDGRSAYTTPIYATEDFFKVFRFPKVAGNYDNIFVDNNSIALSEDTAKQLFDKDYLNSIGKTVISDNDGSKYVVQAIYKLPADYENTVFRGGYITREPFINNSKNSWTNYSYFGFFKVKPNTDLAKLEEKLSKWDDAGERAESVRGGWAPNEKPIKVHLTNIRDMKLDAKGSGIMKGDKKSIIILLSLAVLILVLSGINFINLNTAQASQRAKEVGVRKVLGGSKSKIILQFLLETFIVYCTAFIISMVLLELLLPLYSKFLKKEIHVDGVSIYVYTILILFIFTFISGIIPATYLSNFNPIQTLKGNFARSKHGIWLRNFILTIQLIISSFFIISSLIIYKQVNYMMDKDLGFNGNQVFQIRFQKTNFIDDGYNQRKYEIYKEKIKRFPGVMDVTGSSQTMGRGVANTSGAMYKKDSTRSTSAGIGAIDLNSFKFYNIKFVAGRDFNPKMTTDTARGLIVNEAFVKDLHWSNEEALGKEIWSGMDKKSTNMLIIGVVKNFYYGSVKNEVPPVMFFNYQRYWSKNQMTNLQIKLSGDNIAENTERIKKYWETEVEPGYPFVGNFVNENFAKTFDKYKKQRLLFTILNSVVLVVALLGLFALSSLMIEQKLKDVAIKKTLGASDGALIKDLTRKFLWVTALAVLLSIPVSYYFMNEWLKEFAYRIEMPWWPYMLSLIILLLLTFLVVSIKAYRATKVELVKYLKYE
ncbi:ABC transporter permease [Elizabethkingia meningoseptica]|uniref:FtsX-like permease family protein n=1 Tax=Elizabethkingia meningoseptica TaxID=238 RepID=UPI0023AEAEDF|nr:FtsX-like permease family protein [Elizabethkingia meningoseptica]MDE5481837.1 ABC transporter permease [Elizabethkingia meningoseptica]